MFFNRVSFNQGFAGRIFSMVAGLFAGIRKKDFWASPNTSRKMPKRINLKLHIREKQKI